MNFSNVGINTKGYTFLVYNHNFIVFFFLLGICFIFYCSHKLLFILKKKNSNDFLTLSEEDMRDTTIRQLINSLITRHLYFIFFFIFTYFPLCIMMLIKECLGVNIFDKGGGYYLNYILMSLVSLNGMFNFCVKLTDPFMRGYMVEMFCVCNSVSFQRTNSSLEGFDLNINDDESNRSRYNGSNSHLNNIESVRQSKIEMSDMNKKENINPNKIIEIPIMTTTSKCLNLKSTAVNVKNITSTSASHLKDSFLSTSSNRQSSNRNKARRLTKCNSHSMLKHFNSIKHSYNKMILNEGIIGFDLVTYHIDLDDNLLRMLAISVALSEAKVYDHDFKYKKYYVSLLPWREESFYKEKTPWKKYTQNNIPDCIPAKSDSRFKNAIFRIKSFSPFVFHHLRLIDNISIDDIIRSLDPIRNLSMINELGVSGGRGDNVISTSWDKKILIKTISHEEKKLFKQKMLKEYHCRMRDTKSLLCRIYGLFKIEVNDKGSIHVLLQKNMCDLPSLTSLLTFDLKGSTVDRQCISSADEKRLSHDELMSKYKNKVLKDKDLTILKIKFNLNSYDGRNLITCIEKDSLFLERYSVTDYSLLVFVHRYQREDICQNFGNLRIMQSYDNKYIFNFSIIDFLGTFNFEKKSEKLAKDFVSLIKKTKDTNFSVLDPTRYGLRFRSYARSIIDIESE